MHDDVARPLTVEALDRLLLQRFSCRQYLDKPVPHETIERILALAQRTPSWSNTQTWQVIVTEGAGTEHFRGAMGEHLISGAIAPDIAFPVSYSGDIRARRRDCGVALYTSLGIERGDADGSFAQMLRNFDLFDAPHVVIITADAELGSYGAIDCGLYLQTFLLAAQSLGVATVAQAALATYAPFIRDHFDLSEHRQVVCGISFGYADLDHPVNGFRTGRESLDRVVTWRTD